MTRRVVTRANSVIGEGGDWEKLDFEGKTVHIEYRGSFGPKEERAPFPFVDGSATLWAEYLHVPYDWAEDQRVYRVYPRWAVGDRLWVKETWQVSSSDEGTNYVIYKADGARADRWRSSLFMPRWASRITLEITRVRVQRLQEITEEDAAAEGDPKQGLIASENDHVTWFRGLWDSLNARRDYGWASNCWVWAISFKVLKGG